MMLQLKLKVLVQVVRVLHRHAVFKLGRDVNIPTFHTKDLSKL